MGKDFVFKLNKKGVRELLSSGEAQAICGEHAQRIFSQVSGIDGYVMEPRKYPERAGYAVVAKKFPAIADNLKHNTLAKAGKI